MKKDAKKIRIVFNSSANTLDVWFGNPESEFVCEETGDEIILKKDSRNRVIGSGKLNVLGKKEKPRPFEIISV